MLREYDLLFASSFFVRAESLKKMLGSLVLSLCAYSKIKLNAFFCQLFTLHYDLE